MGVRNSGQGVSERAAGLSRFLLKILWKCLGVGVLDFLLLGVWGPNLVNRHQNLALAGAIVCLLIALAATGWLMFQLWLEISRLRHRGPRPTLVYRRPTED